MKSIIYLLTILATFTITGSVTVLAQTGSSDESSSGDNTSPISDEELYERLATEDYRDYNHECAWAKLNFEFLKALIEQAINKLFILQNNLHQQGDTPLNETTPEQIIFLNAQWANAATLIEFINTTLEELKTINQTLAESINTNPAYQNPLNTVELQQLQTLYRSAFTNGNWENAINNLQHFILEHNPSQRLDSLAATTNALINLYNFLNHNQEFATIDITQDELRENLQIRIEEASEDDNDSIGLVNYTNEILHYLEHQRLSPKIQNLNAIYVQYIREQQKTFGQEIRWVYHHIRFMQTLIPATINNGPRDYQTLTGVLETLNVGLNALNIAMNEIIINRIGNPYFRLEQDRRKFLNQLFNHQLFTEINTEATHFALQAMAIDALTTDFWQWIPTENRHFINEEAYIRFINTLTALNHLLRILEDYVQGRAEIAATDTAYAIERTQRGMGMEDDTESEQAYYQLFLNFLQGNQAPETNTPAPQGPTNPIIIQDNTPIMIQPPTRYVGTATGFYQGSAQ